MGEGNDGGLSSGGSGPHGQSFRQRRCHPQSVRPPWFAKHAPHAFTNCLLLFPVAHHPCQKDYSERDLASETLCSSEFLLKCIYKNLKLSGIHIYMDTGTPGSVPRMALVAA